MVCRMPHAFQVLTRALKALRRQIISGLCYWYVDGVTLYVL